MHKFCFRVHNGETQVVGDGNISSRRQTQLSQQGYLKFKYNKTRLATHGNREGSKKKQMRENGGSSYYRTFRFIKRKCDPNLHTRMKLR